MGWMIEVRLPGGAEIFLITTASRQALGPTQPLIQRLPGINWPELEADHSSLSSTEVRMCGAIPPHVSMAWCFV